jgi:hypothetical protein
MFQLFGSNSTRQRQTLAELDIGQSTGLSPKHMERGFLAAQQSWQESTERLNLRFSQLAQAIP